MEILCARLKIANSGRHYTASYQLSSDHLYRFSASKIQCRILGGTGDPGPRPSTNRGPPTKPLNFLANDVSLVILIEDIEINEKLCTLAVSFHSLVNLCIR